MNGLNLTMLYHGSHLCDAFQTLQLGYKLFAVSMGI